MDPIDMNDYIQDAHGRLVPRDKVKAVDLVRDQLVRELFCQAAEMSERVRTWRNAALAEVDAFVRLSHETYGLEYKGGSFTLTSFDGSLRLSVDRNELVRFNEQLDAARQLIAQCLGTWTDGGADELRQLVNLAFRKNKQGQISVTNVMQLRKIQTTNPTWELAMVALENAITIAESVRYLRFHRRKGDKWELVNLHPGGVAE